MRTYKRKSQRGTTSPHLMLRAAKEVKIHGRSIRGAAKDFNLPESSLRRFLNKVTDAELHGVAETPVTNIGYVKPRQVIQFCLGIITCISKQL